MINGEKMKNVSLSLVVMFLFSSTSFAEGLHIEGLNFTAPSINGSANVSNPVIGDIVYDLTAGGFFGYNQSGSWVNLGPGTNNSTLATLSNYTGVAVHGTNTDDNAASGYIGEFISSNPTTSVTPAASGTYVNITSITLTAGDWDVEGVINLTTDSTWVGTQWGAQVSTTSAGSDSQANGAVNWHSGTISASGTYFVPTGTRRISLAATSTPIYLTAQLTYTTLGATVFGTNSYIRARRVR
jgi:hypothetical protein